MRADEDGRSPHRLISPGFELVYDDHVNHDSSQGHLGPVGSAFSEGSRKTSPKVSAITLSINLVTACLGCGILSLPWTTAGASIVPAVGITFVALSLNAGTIMILVVAAERTQIFDLGGLFKMLPRSWGKVARLVCDISIWVSVFFCLVSYLIVAADSLETLKVLAPVLKRRPLCVGLVTVIALPLCFLDQNYLVISSSLCIVANIYMFGMLLAMFLNPHPVVTGCCLFGVGRGSVTMFYGLMQAAVVQMCVLPMYEQLENRSIQRFANCLAASFFFVFVLFVSFSSVAYPDRKSVV